MSKNVNDLYADVLATLSHAKEEMTRNGPAKSLSKPSVWTMTNPKERVLFNQERRANPYFHVMETIWMFAGESHVGWLEDFNKNISSYAEPNGVIHGAYGNRWRRAFGRDQIEGAVNQLRKDPYTRQCVIAMWDPTSDHHSHWKDRPCNTHLYFRNYEGRLDMTVCNRSNDAVWGMTGANAVHMTYLHELISSAVNVRMGHYHVMTNNLHIYSGHYKLMENPTNLDLYEHPDINPLPLLRDKDNWWEFLYECEMFMKHQDDYHYQNYWLRNVAVPMYQHYICRLNGDKHTYDTSEVKATDWRAACDLWREWYDSSN